MSTTLDDASIGEELKCPVPGCSYTHTSANGIIGHVGNSHPDGWDAADVTPRDVHQRATERDEAAMRRVAKVEERVTDHAALRWLQRVNAREPRPAERVRQALARARRSATLDPRGPRDPRTDAVLVVRGGVVRTVLLGGEARQ